MAYDSLDYSTFLGKLMQGYGGGMNYAGPGQSVSSGMNYTPPSSQAAVYQPSMAAMEGAPAGDQLPGGTDIIEPIEPQPTGGLAPLPGQPAPMPHGGGGGGGHGGGGGGGKNQGPQLKPWQQTYNDWFSSGGQYFGDGRGGNQAYMKAVMDGDIKAKHAAKIYKYMNPGAGNPTAPGSFHGMWQGKGPITSMVSPIGPGGSAPSPFVPVGGGSAQEQGMKNAMQTYRFGGR